MKIDPSDANSTEFYRLFSSVVVPRPIAWVSTIGENGIFNLAPFSFFGIISASPALIYVSIGHKRDGQKKDTLVNIESSRDFVVNIVTEDLAKVMNQSSAEYPSDVNEFKEVGLTSVKADIVTSPMLAESPVNIECQQYNIMEFGDSPRRSSMVVGEAVRVHIKDELYVDGAIQFSALKALGRHSGNLYCGTTDIIEMERPSVV
jgi:flavin reductase (DIM6/NTAB) family NADH-FMN oxidoreductase RutF